MAGSLALIYNSTVNTDTGSTGQNDNSAVATWQTNDLYIVIVHDTAAGATISVTKQSGTTLTLEDGASFSGTTSNLDVRSSAAYGNPEFVSIWSTRIDADTAAIIRTVVTFAGGTNPKRYSIWRLRPNSGKTIPARGSRTAYSANYTGGNGGANAVDTVSMSGSGPGAHDQALIAAAYTSSTMASNPNYDADNDGTYEVTSTEWGTDVFNISAATWASQVATITTTVPHRFSTRQTVTIAGVTPSGWNGSFNVSGILSTTQFTCTITSNPGTYTSGGTLSVPSGYNAVGCCAWGRFYSNGDANPPGATEKIKYVSTPSAGGVKAFLAISYLAETPTDYGDATISAAATLTPAGNATHYASATISAAVSLHPSSNKVGDASISAAATLTPAGTATHHASAAIAVSTLLTAAGNTGRLGYINRHATARNSGVGDQGPITVPVFLGDVVAVLLSTATATSYADVTGTNCTLRSVAPGGIYDTVARAITAASQVLSGGSFTTTYTSNSHGFLVGEHVTVTGITVSSGSAATYNVTDLAITAVTTNTFSIVTTGTGGTYLSGGSAKVAIPCDNTNMRAAADDSTDGIFSRIWLAKVVAVSGAATVSAHLRNSSLPGNMVLTSISPGQGSYFDETAMVITDASGVPTGSSPSTNLVTYNQDDAWPTLRGFAFLTAVRYNGSAKGLDIDFDADGTNDVTHTLTPHGGPSGGPGGGGDLGGCLSPGISTMWFADAYYPYPGIARPTAGGIYYTPTTAAGQRATCALVIATKRIFEPAVELDVAQHIGYVKGWHLGVAEEQSFNGPGVRGSFGVVPAFGTAVNWTKELDLAQPIIGQKSRHITFGLGNPGPGPFFGYTLTAWAYKLSPAQIGDIRLNLYDGSTLLQQSGWFTLTSDEAAYSLNITSTVAARTTLRCVIEARTFGTLFQPAVTAVRFAAAAGSLGVATELDGTDPGGVRVRIAGQDFSVNKIQM